MLLNSWMDMQNKQPLIDNDLGDDYCIDKIDEISDEEED